MSLGLLGIGHSARKEPSRGTTSRDTPPWRKALLQPQPWALARPQTTCFSNSYLMPSWLWPSLSSTSHSSSYPALRQRPSSAAVGAFHRCSSSSLSLRSAPHADTRPSGPSSSAEPPEDFFAIPSISHPFSSYSAVAQRSDQLPDSYEFPSSTRSLQVSCTRPSCLASRTPSNRATSWPASASFTNHAPAIL